jgi:methanogenic corrinoid protein MtbC1
VGGGAVTPEFAENIGADGYGADPIEAVRLAKAIVQAD